MTETFRGIGGNNEEQTRIAHNRNWYAFVLDFDEPIRNPIWDFARRFKRSDLRRRRRACAGRLSDNFRAGMHWIYLRRDGTAFADPYFPANVPNPLAFPDNPRNGQIVYCSYDGEWRVYTPAAPVNGLPWVIPANPMQRFVFLGWALQESNGTCLFARGVIPIERQELIEQIAFGNFRSQTINGFLTQSAPFDS